MKEARGTSGEATARKHGIHPRRMREWKQQDSQLKSVLQMLDDQEGGASTMAPTDSPVAIAPSSTAESVKEDVPLPSTSDVYNHDTEVDSDSPANNPSTSTTSSVTITEKPKRKKRVIKKGLPGAGRKVSTDG